MKDKLILAGVKNLNEFGYPNCNSENITKDYIYKQFFVSMLKESKGKAGMKVDKEIDKLLKLCEE